MTAALELAQVDVELGGRPVLTAVDLAVRPGEVVGVVGANGSGKTTLLRAGLGLVKLKSGEARLGGLAVGALSEMERADLAGYLPQERRVAWNMPAWRVAALGATRLSPAAARDVAYGALEELGVDALAPRGVRDMSGGERSKVLIARMIATGAPLLVADEPTAGLDPDAALRVMEVLRDRARSGVAIIATMHDLTLAARSCDRLAVLKSGRLIALAEPPAALTSPVLVEAFALEGELLATPAGWVLAAQRRAHGDK